jgi:survival-of-motor-neuron-related-splicing factor 30
VNDTVMAKWVSGDKAFYSAKITLITGSSSAPKYHVKFIGYNSTDVVQGSDIKPQSNESKKRKVDGIPVTQTATPVSGNSNVISAAASIDPMLASQVRKEPSKVSDGPPKPAKVPRKVKANKELEAGKSKWMDFMQKGPKTTATKKESMFRTPDGVNARGQIVFPIRFCYTSADPTAVGFTGSGAPMRKDPNRGRHIYQAGGEDN